MVIDPINTVSGTDSEKHNAWWDSSGCTWKLGEWDVSRAGLFRGAS